MQLIYPLLNPLNKMGGKSNQNKEFNSLSARNGRTSSLSGFNTSTDSRTDLTKEQKSIAKNGMKKSLFDVQLQNYVVFIPRMLRSPNDILSSQKTTLKEYITDVLQSISTNAGAGFNKDDFEASLTPVLNKNGGAEDYLNNLYIALPLKPDFLKINLSHNWRMEKALGVTAKHAANLGLKFLKSGGTEGLDIKGMGKDLLKMGGSFLASKVIEEAGGPLSQLGVFSYRPEKQVYSGSKEIQLTFSWTLSPNSEEEAEEIRKICLSFAILSHPQPPVFEEKELGISLHRNPALWRIDFPNSGKFSNMIRKDNSFPAMVCNSINFSFGEEDFWVSFKDGFPPVINIEAQFTEYFTSSSAQDRYGMNINEVFKKS